jgi:hypothetical protein
MRPIGRQIAKRQLNKYKKKNRNWWLKPKGLLNKNKRW